MKPRVLFLDHTGSLGGAEHFLLDIVRDHLGTSRVVLLADGPFRERLEEVGAEVEVLPAPGAVSGVSREGGIKRDVLAVPGVLRLARQVAKRARDCELIYANSQKALVVGALAGKLTGKPVIWHQHDLLTAEHFSGGHRRLAVFLSNRMVTRVIACSRAAAKALVEGGGPPERVHVVYNGIDPAPFETPATDGEDLRRELGLGEETRLVGVFSRLAPWKGQHVLLEALPRLPRVHAVLVGDAIFGERAYADALRRQSKDLGVDERVHFLGFRRDIPRLMRLMDVVAHTSVAAEPFGRVIVEGMLARSPVVATRAGGAVEIVDDGISGVLVPPGDAKALAGALDGLLVDGDRARALAETGREKALERFSLQAMLDGVERHLREVAGSPAAALGS